MSYPFKEKDYSKITIYLIVEILAFQQALTDAVLDEINDEEKANRIVKRINELLPDKKEKILEQIYTAFGDTPKV